MYFLSHFDLNLSLSTSTTNRVIRHPSHLSFFLVRKPTIYLQGLWLQVISTAILLHPCETILFLRFLLFVHHLLHWMVDIHTIRYRVWHLYSIDRIFHRKSYLALQEQYNKEYRIFVTSSNLDQKSQMFRNQL